MIGTWPQRTREFTCPYCRVTQPGTPNQITCTRARCQERHKRKLYARAKLRAKRGK